MLSCLSKIQTGDILFIRCLSNNAIANSYDISIGLSSQIRSFPADTDGKNVWVKSQYHGGIIPLNISEVAIVKIKKKH